MCLQIWSIHFASILLSPFLFTLDSSYTFISNMRYWWQKNKISLSDLTQIPKPHKPTPPHATTHPPEIIHICTVVTAAGIQVVIPSSQTHYQMSGRIPLHLLQSSETYPWLSDFSPACLACLSLSILLLSQVQITC